MISFSIAHIYFMMPWEFMFHPADADIIGPAAPISTSNYNSQHTSPPRTKWEPVIPDKLRVLPAILWFWGLSHPSFLHLSVLFFSVWLSNGATAKATPNALTPRWSVKSNHFPPLRWQEMRWCHDECGRCLFQTDELKSDCGLTVSQMLSMMMCENWARRK